MRTAPAWAAAARRGTAALALALAACGGVETAPDLVLRDSAGVAVVEHGARALEAAEPWSLAAAPSLDLHSDEARGVLLFNVTDVLPLPDGRVALANGGSKEVLVFGADGALLRRFGAEGDGPEEFRSMSGLFALGDSLAVYDGQRRRLTVWGPGGTLAREVALADLTTERASYSLHPLRGPAFAVFASGGLRSEPGRFRTEAESIRIGADGARLSSYGRFPGAELTVFPGGAGAVLFGAVTVAATAADHLVVGLGELPEIRYHRPEGTLARIVRWPDRDRLVPPERIERFLVAMLAELPEEQHAAMRAFFERAPKAERAPPYEDFVGSASGDLWVGGYVGPERLTPSFREPAREWLVFGPDGALRARLASPEGFAVRAFTDELAYGVFTDELGVESVRAYPMARGR